MSLTDAVVVLLVLAFAVSRFVAHRLPRDPRKPAERKGGWQAFTSDFGRKVEESRKPKKPEQPMATRTRPVAPKRVDVSGLVGIAQVKALEPGFDEEAFKAATAAAYKRFYKAWNAMDEDKLAAMCGPELMAKLGHTLQDYRDKGSKPLVTVNSVRVDIAKAYVKGRSGVIEAVISAVQTDDVVKATRGATQAQPHKTEAVWLLAKALPSEDPNWELQAITHKGARA